MQPVIDQRKLRGQNHHVTVTQSRYCTPILDSRHDPDTRDHPKAINLRDQRNCTIFNEISKSSMSLCGEIQKCQNAAKYVKLNLLKAEWNSHGHVLVINSSRYAQGDKSRDICCQIPPRCPRPSGELILYPSIKCHRFVEQHSPV